MNIHSGETAAGGLRGGVRGRFGAPAAPAIKAETAPKDRRNNAETTDRTRAGIISGRCFRQPNRGRYWPDGRQSNPSPRCLSRSAAFLFAPPAYLSPGRSQPAGMEASTIARMPAFIASGSLGQASTSRARSGSIRGTSGGAFGPSAVPPIEGHPRPAESAFWSPIAPDSAPPACESASFPAESEGVFAPLRGTCYDRSGAGPQVPVCGPKVSDEPAPRWLAPWFSCRGISELLRVLLRLLRVPLHAPPGASRFTRE